MARAAARSRDFATRDTLAGVATADERTGAGDSRLRRAGPALAAAALALAVYAVTLGGTYVYDDVFIARDDPRLHDTSRWGEYWTSDYFAGGVDRLYRPLVSMSYAVQWRLHGDRPALFHAVNWVMHAIVSALVAELARRLTASAMAGYVAGLLFAVHPIHVEAVANIVGRAELMCAAGVVGALVLMARRPLTGGRAAGVVACLVLALLSKEQGMLLPLMLLLVAAVRWLERSGAPAAEAERRNGMLLAFSVCVVLAAYVVARETFIRFYWNRNLLDWTANPLVRSRGIHQWLMPLALLGRYAALMVVPLRLSPNYGGTVIGHVARWDDPYGWVGAAVVLGWVMLVAGATIKRRWWVLFCLLSLALVYGLVSNVATLIGTIFGERLMYLPSVFVLVLVGMTAARLPRRGVAAAVSVLVGLGTLRAVTYAGLWNDRVGFYETALREQPRSVEIALLLGNELRLRGELDRAERVLAQARAATPDYWLVYNYSALVALEQGRFDEAEGFLRRSMALEPTLQAVAISEEVDRARAATRPAK